MHCRYCSPEVKGGVDPSNDVCKYGPDMIGEALYTGPDFATTTSSQVGSTPGCYVDSITTSQVTVTTAVGSYSNTDTSITIGPATYQADALNPGLFAAATSSSVTPALAFDNDTLLPLDIGGRYYCQWPDCTVSCRRQADWHRHFQLKHFNIRWFCDEPGCEKGVLFFEGYCRQDKVKKHIRTQHIGSVSTGVSYFC